MSITTTIDRSGVRWIKFNSVYVQLTGATSKNAARDLQNAVSEENIREYQQLDLDVNHQIKSEQGKSKFINDAGIIEYANRSNGQKETIDDILTKLGLTLQSENNTNIAVYYESLTFDEENVHIEDTFCVLKVFGKIWIEAVKLCRFFDYADPWKAIREHITAENKSTVENLLQTNGSSNRGEIRLALGNQLRKVSPDMLLINEAGIWQLSQHSRKPMLKRFWANMCKTLSERYNMEFDAQHDAVFAVPKTTKRKMDENADGDVQNYKVQMLEAQLRASEAEKKTLQVEKQLVTEQCKIREFQAMYLYNVERSTVVDSLFLNQMTETAVQKETLASVTRTLRSNEYAVVPSISDVNPSKETIIAFIWLRWKRTFSAVRQIRESFDKQYKFIKTDAESKVKNRVTKKEPRRYNEGQTVIIGKEFVSCNAQNDWTRFKNENPYMMFGVEFVNHALIEFTILTKDDLRQKYNTYKQYEKRRSTAKEHTEDDEIQDQNPTTESFYKLNKRLMIHKLRSLKKLKRALGQTKRVNERKLKDTKQMVQKYELRNNKLECKIKQTNDIYYKRLKMLRQIRYKHLKLLCEENATNWPFKNTECVVCFEKYKKMVQLDKCKHELCIKCLKRLRDFKNIKCPYCRQWSNGVVGVSKKLAKSVHESLTVKEDLLDQQEIQNVLNNMSNSDSDD